MRRRTGLVWIACLLVTGCGRPGSAPSRGVTYRIGDNDGHLTLILNQLTLVFEGIPADPGANGSGGALFVSTVPGASGGGSSDFGKVSINHKETEGVCTVTVNNAVTFQLTEGGSNLVLAGKTYSVNDAQTVVVGKDGTPR
jgi:hypothetical protein